MTRRRRNSPADDLHAELSTTFTLLPWWAGPPFAAVIYSFIRWPLAWMIAPTDATTPMGAVWSAIHVMIPTIALAAGSCVLLIWASVQLKQWSNRHLLNSQSGLGSIRNLTWREFEDLLCESFRREGYTVEHTGSDGPDGGIDIRIQKGSTRSIVQCKHWKRQQVGVAIVREMFGLLHSEKVDSAIVVTSGCFSPDATEFARKNDVRLVDGKELAQLILAVKHSGSKPNAGAQHQAPTSRQDSQPEPQNLSFTIPPCPKCGDEMTKRTARKGSRAGQPFWGCRRYPDCNGIVNI